MRGKGLIVGAALLFAPVSCGPPTVGDACAKDDRECHDNVGYFCDDGEWKSVKLQDITCDCWDGDNPNCAAIGYIGITASGAADCPAPNVRRLRRRRAA